MAKESAGLLPHRVRNGSVEVFLVHPGGPFWAKKDTGAWSIAKGEVEAGEDRLSAAIREFREETGRTLEGEFVALPPVVQPGGKRVWAWAVAADFEPTVRSNTFTLGGREFPEVDKGDWFDLATARVKLLRGQLPLLEHLAALLG